jgi:hypothetical protein
MSSLLILLALLSVATLAARRGAVADVIGGASAPVLVAFGVLVGPAGLSFISPVALASLASALDVGIVWIAFLIGARVASSDVHHAEARDVQRGAPDADVVAPHSSAHAHDAVSPLADVARVAAALSAAFVAGALLALVEGAAALGYQVVPGGTRIALLLPLALGLAAVRIAGARKENAPTYAQRAYARPVELLALGAAVGVLAFGDARMSVAVIALGMFAASLVFLLARQGAIPPAAAMLGALLLLAGLARLANVPAAVAALVAGAAFTLTRGADAVLGPIGATERPVRIVVLVLLAASIELDVAPVAAGVILGVAIAVLHALVLLFLARDPRPSHEPTPPTPTPPTPQAPKERRRLPLASITPLLIIASFAAVAAIDGAHALLSIAVVAYAVRDALLFALSWARPRSSTRPRSSRPPARTPATKDGGVS